MPIVPISTHSTVRTSPTRSAFNGRIRGVSCDCSNIVTLSPANGGKRFSETGTSRATSAVASWIETPGFSRAIAL